MRRSHALLVLLCTSVLQADETTSLLIADVKKGPARYETPAAQQYFVRKQFGAAATPPATTDNALATRMLKSLAALADRGREALEAVGPIVEAMPVAVHVINHFEPYDGGAGTFEDWLATKLMGEKNKFMLSPPFLDYDALSLCDDFLTITEEHTRPSQGNVSLTVVFTFHAGACALSRITGVNAGTDPEAWRQWWLVNKSTYAPSSPATAPASDNPWAPAATSAPPAQSSTPPSTGITGTRADKLIIHGTYKVYLKTGDILVGTIEANNGGSIIIETKERGAFTFGENLIDQYELLSLPQKKSSPAGGGIHEAEILTFDAVANGNYAGRKVTVKMTSGATFTGVLSVVKNNILHLDVEGSTIPIAKDVIETIETVPARTDSPGAATPHKKQTVSGPFDTVVVLNPETDDYGRRKENLVYIGKIRDGKSSITLTSMDGTEKTIQRKDIVRIKKYTVDTFQEKIQRYAKSLFCPENMFLVDVPPGKEGRPFFKVCIDRFEYPNKKGAMPKGNVTFQEADALCKKEGKRLCTVDEWKFGCSGLEEYTYPYGHNYDEELCNTGGTNKIKPSGIYGKCVSKFGGYDMSGNIFEWVAGENNRPMAMGGPYSKCHTVSPGGGGEALPQRGFRCCKSN